MKFVLTLWPEICWFSQVRLWPSSRRQKRPLGINQPIKNPSLHSLRKDANKPQCLVYQPTNHDTEHHSSWSNHRRVHVGTQMDMKRHDTGGRMRRLHSHTYTSIHFNFVCVMLVCYCRDRWKTLNSYSLSWFPDVCKTCSDSGPMLLIFFLTFGRKQGHHYI